MVRVPGVNICKKKIFFLIIFFVFFVLMFYFIARINNVKSSRNCPDDEPIDVVYTWVNGSDPKFLSNLKQYLLLYQNVDASKQRYEDKNELRFSLRSLEKFAPWINHVYLVTNGQIPYWLNLECNKITIITHEMIFKNSANLPTFSSPAIESNLHRIPGLSKKFIYFNDDIFLGQQLYPDDFYTHGKGYSIFLTYPIPDCTSNCPWLYVGDGQCDWNCYNEKCQFDGGDCEDKTVEIINEDENDSNDSTELPTNQRVINELDSLKEKAHMILHQNAVSRHTNSPKTRVKIHANHTAFLSRLVKDHNKRVMVKNKLLSRKRRRLLKGKMKTIVPKYNGFVDSLVYTQRVFNKKYWFKLRYTPAHAPIFLDRDIMQSMENKFLTEFELTERNRFRHSNDMQFGFTYYYFVISETVKRTIYDIFDLFDTDNSGTWSDREIRNLLTQIYELPLSYEIVDHFDGLLFNCSEFHKNLEVKTPPNERYLDSKLPTISKDIIVNCKFLSEFLRKRFELVSKYKYHIVRDSEKYSSFNMLVSNISNVVIHLDEIRRSPRKFICLNDDLDESKESENDLVKAILYDFYMSLFPHPSRFELPDHARNRFLHMDELQEWKKQHFIVKTCLLIAIVSLIIITFFGVLKKLFCKLFIDLFC